MNKNFSSSSLMRWETLDFDALDLIRSGLRRFGVDSAYILLDLNFFSDGTFRELWCLDFFIEIVWSLYLFS